MQIRIPIGLDNPKPKPPQEPALADIIKALEAQAAAMAKVAAALEAIARTLEVAVI